MIVSQRPNYLTLLESSTYEIARLCWICTIHGPFGLIPRPLPAHEDIERERRAEQMIHIGSMSRGRKVEWEQEQVHMDIHYTVVVA